jgi:probable phosphoglycerate mutase
MTTPARPSAFDHPFYFLRHGETEYNAQRRIAGSHETVLTERGHDEARRAAEMLATVAITAIYTSPMQRALDTARYVADRLALPFRVIDAIAERHWGSLEGRPRSERKPGEVPQDAETLEAFTVRVLRGFDEVRGEVPLVVAHSGVFRVLCRTLNIAAPDQPVTNALPLRFEPMPGGWRMASLRSTG